MSDSPPRLAARLLERWLDPASHDAVAGDLDEEFARRRRHGARRAAAWYWRQAIGSIVSLRVTGRRRADRRLIDLQTGGHMTLHDLLRPAFRQFRDHPLYAFASAGTLALAIAAACTAFAVVKRAFLDPLPYRDDARLVSILTSAEGRRSAVSAHVLEDLRGAASPFNGFVPIRPFGVAYQGAEGAEPLLANVTTTDYFAVLGVTPAIGRAFTDREPGAIVVSWKFWQRALGGDPRAIGRQLVLDGQTHTVVGIMPEAFVGPYWAQSDVWMPLDLGPLLAGPRRQRTLTIVARRQREIPQAQAEAFLAAFSGELQKRHPDDHGRMTFVAIPLRDELVGPARPALLGTASAAGLLLLIVCANIAGLSTAHAAAVQKQMAIRAALGATRARLFASQLVDSLAIAVVGTGAGLGLGSGLVQLVAAYQPQFLERLAPIALDASTVAVVAIAGLAVGVVAALLPRGVVPAGGDGLRARGATGDLRVTSMRAALVAVQVALTLVLIVGAGLLLRTVSHLARLPLGFDSQRLTTFSINLPGAKYRTEAAQVQFERAVVERLSGIHGATAVTSSIGFPIYGGMGAGLLIQGRPATNGLTEIAYLSVAPDFMTTVGARLVAGRDLAVTDTEGTPGVVLINETMARMFWPEGGAIGAQVKIGGGSPQEPWITVVGIVADLTDLGPVERVRPIAFGSTAQYSWPRRHFSVRTGEKSSAALAMDIRAAVAAVDPAIPVGALRAVDEMASERTARHRLVTLALAVFGLVSLALSAAGLYAVVALTSRVRRREYAIRMALGAARGGVRWMVIRQALVVAGSGAAAGAVIAALATRSIQGLLHGVEPLDPATFGLGGLGLLALALAASWQPARQAERANPAEVLQAE